MVLLLAGVLSSLAADPLSEAVPPGPVATYEVDISVEEDLFHVTFRPGPLTKENAMLRFAAYAPGVHSTLDFGRFVRELVALDSAGEALEVERVDTNSWRLGDPARVDRIVYTAEDTFDADVDEHLVIACAGTGIAVDYALVNPLGLLPYFEGLLQRPVRLQLDAPPEWTVGTALDPDGDGAYVADSYRILADRPLLLGELSVVQTWVGDIEVDIYVHSNAPNLNAEEILFGTGEVLEAAGAFLGFAPVERYTFLMVFFDMQSLGNNRFNSFGALEHSTSSVYSLPAMGPVVEMLPSTVAHEFMHVLTPLHLRSDVIANFDYSVPSTDGHLWLYEGLTEWTAGILRLRNEVIDLDTYLSEMSGKIQAASRFDADYSLERLSLEWFEPYGNRQFGNIYQLGALTSMLLDVRLLELSQGERGLREVFLELIGRYGKDRPFQPDTFLDEFVAATHPEIAAFFRDHVQGNEPLPYGDIMAAIGVDYDPTSGGRPRLSVEEDPGPERLLMREAWMRNLGR